MVHCSKPTGCRVCANGGTVTTPITFHNDTLAGTEADFFMQVPSGTTVIPLDISVQLEAYGTTLLHEIYAAIGSGGTIAGHDALVAGTNICNLRTDAPYTSNCSIGVSCDTTGSTNSTTNVVEFWRDGLQKSVTLATATDDVGTKKYKFNWNAEREGIYPILVGSADLQIHSTAQAPTGFITVIFAEIPSSSIV